MPIKIAEKLVEQMTKGNQFYVQRDLIYLLAVLMAKLEVHAPDEYKIFKENYVDHFINLGGLS